MTNQLVRSGTSIGANIREAQYAHGKADLIVKLQIALKECSESEYWLELLIESDYYCDKAILDFYMRMVDELITKPKECAQEQKSKTLSLLDELSAWLKSQDRNDYDDEAWNAMLEAVKGQMARNY